MEQSFSGMRTIVLTPEDRSIGVVPEALLPVRRANWSLSGAFRAQMDG